MKPLIHPKSGRDGRDWLTGPFVILSVIKTSRAAAIIGLIDIIITPVVLSVFYRFLSKK